ncbi:MAG TPA: hypothetical protein VEG84_09190, partial [Thermoanaerobaculia bacterium]|nr:hypothetical protein [Thermoanaerobaculia bacterium]
MNALPHPARSAEFLSRLHDGDLTAAERAQFESHRAHCAECRNTAFDFEAALSLYRSSRPRPASEDLSARILHKLQRSNRRRIPLGGSVALNLRWAGAFAAAILAAIIGFSVVARQESRRLAAREVAAVPVTIDGKLQANEAASNKMSEIAAAKPAAPPISRPQPQASLEKPAALDKDQRGGRSDSLRKESGTGGDVNQPPAYAPAPAAPPALAAKAPAANEPSAADKKTLSVSSGAAAENSFARDGASAQRHANIVVAPIEKQGGEGSSVASPVQDLDEETRPVRLVLTAADGGATPEAIGDAKVILPPGERGHEYLLVVDAQGRVSEV